MPTTLPVRARKKTDTFIAFVVALYAAFFLIELADPAPMEAAAALMGGP